MSIPPEPSPPPRPHVLNYITSAANSSPTHICLLTAKGLAITSWAFLAVFNLLLTLLILDFSRDDPWSGTTWSFLWDRIWDYATDSPFACALTAALLLLAIAARVTVSPIRRARSWACILALTILITTAFLTITTAALLVGFAIVEAFPRLPRFSNPQPLYLLWILPAPLFVLATLLCSDLSRFLLWILRTPIAENPNAHFLPTRPHQP